MSTPAGIERFLLEALDEPVHGQVNTAVRQAKDAYAHRDDPSWQAHADIAERQAQNQATQRHREQVDAALAGDPVHDPETFDDAVERLEGDPYGDAERLRLEMAEAAAGAGVPFPPEPSSRELFVELMAIRRELDLVYGRLDLMYGLLRSMAAGQGLNVDDESIEAAAVLWNEAPRSAADIASYETDSHSITAQLANDWQEIMRQSQPATRNDPPPDWIPVSQFAQWFGMADHDAQASDG